MPVKPKKRKTAKKPVRKLAARRAGRNTFVNRPVSGEFVHPTEVTHHVVPEHEFVDHGTGHGEPPVPPHRPPSSIPAECRAKYAELEERIRILRKFHLDKEAGHMDWAYREQEATEFLLENIGKKAGQSGPITDIHRQLGELEKQVRLNEIDRQVLEKGVNTLSQREKDFMKHYNETIKEKGMAGLSPKDHAEMRKISLKILRNADLKPEQLKLKKESLFARMGKDGFEKGISHLRFGEEQKYIYGKAVIGWERELWMIAIGEKGKKLKKEHTMARITNPWKGALKPGKGMKQKWWNNPIHIISEIINPFKVLEVIFPSIKDSWNKKKKLERYKNLADAERKKRGVRVK